MSAPSQALFDSITRQLYSSTSDPQIFYESTVVGLIADDGSTLVIPHEGDLSFAKAFGASRPASAIKAKLPVLSFILANTHPTTEHIAVDRNTKLTILSSLESTFEFSATQSAVIVRDEAALLVYSDDARSVAQRFLQVEQQLRQYARQCKCTVASSSESHSGSSTDAQPVSSHSHGYLFASEHGVASASDGSYVGPSTELPELDLPFRPLNVEEMVHDMQSDCGPNIASDASYGITWDMFNDAPVSPWRSALPSSQLNPGRIFSSAYMMSMSAASQEEPQTVSPSMLHTPSTATSFTLSPTSSSDSPVTPTSGYVCLPACAFTEDFGIPPKSVYGGVGFASSPLKTLEDTESDDYSVYNQIERHGPRPASHTPQSSAYPLVRNTPTSSSQDAPSSPSQVPACRAKRKRGRPPKAPKVPQSRVASPAVRAVLPLPRRSANRAVVEKSTTTRLHPLPGCNLRSLRSRVREPSSMSPSATQPTDSVPRTSEVQDGGEDPPIDSDGSDEDDGAYEPSPKRARVDAESDEPEKVVTTKGKRGPGGLAKGNKRGNKRRPRTACGSRRGHFPCTEENCDMIFTRETDMKRHVEWVHKKPGVRCPDCLQVYARNDSLKRHRVGGKCPKMQLNLGQLSEHDDAESELDEDMEDDEDDELPEEED